ncbi:MAG: FHA domain-containing protein [Syntrophobacterales bacterium]|jgi:hypothetical protein
MRKFDQRKSPRIRQSFRVKLLRQGVDYTLEGTTANLSQKGAFIRTKHYRSFQAGEPGEFTFFLPPDFTGQDKTVGLQGNAVITRIDQDNEGIGVEFIKSLKQFERVKISEVAGKIRYKKLAQYLASFEDLALSQFVAAYPNGFLVEKSERFLDKDVMFQFLTDVVEDEHVLEQLRQGTVRSAVLDARVIEITKRKDITEPDKITIGRSPDNDIVIYNKMVSRRHAYLQVSSEDQGCFLVDIGSSNGTFLNNNQITPLEKYQLTDADEISIGPKTKVLFFASKAFHAFLSELKP